MLSAAIRDGCIQATTYVLIRSGQPKSRGLAATRPGNSGSLAMASSSTRINDAFCLCALTYPPRTLATSGADMHGAILAYVIAFIGLIITGGGVWALSKLCPSLRVLFLLDED